MRSWSKPSMDRSDRSTVSTAFSSSSASVICPEYAGRQTHVPARPGPAHRRGRRTEDHFAVEQDDGVYGQYDRCHIPPRNLLAVYLILHRIGEQVTRAARDAVCHTPAKPRRGDSQCMGSVVPLWYINPRREVVDTDEHMQPSPNRQTMVVTLDSEVLFQYRRFTLYNSPYVAHDSGRAVDLYPTGEKAPSPVAGEVLDTRTVEAPPQPYAESHDHLILVDTGEHVARLLHVEPSVDPGECVERGEGLGTLVRAGFFAPWVPNHIHLGFRDHDANPYRASGSLPLSVDVPVTPLGWDGTGTVIETGDTWARLDAPNHPNPGEEFVGLQSDSGVLDGGFPHYDGGGLLGSGERALLAGTEVGTVAGRDVTWNDVTVNANGQQITGIALYCARDSFGIKLVGRDVDLDVGEAVEVSVEG